MLQAPLCALLLLGRTSHYQLVNKATNKQLCLNILSPGGAKFLIKAHDQHHVKIFSVSGNFLFKSADYFTHLFFWFQMMVI
jgi:hypothetical protein